MELAERLLNSCLEEVERSSSLRTYDVTPPIVQMVAKLLKKKWCHENSDWSSLEQCILRCLSQNRDCLTEIALILILSTLPNRPKDISIWYQVGNSSLPLLPSRKKNTYHFTDMHRTALLPEPSRTRPLYPSSASPPSFDRRSSQKSFNRSIYDKDSRNHDYPGHGVHGHSA